MEMRKGGVVRGAVFESYLNVCPFYFKLQNVVFNPATFLDMKIYDKIVIHLSSQMHSRIIVHFSLSLFETQ